MKSDSMGGYILFEDGLRLNGDLFLGKQAALGEAVFNTSHSGYQEILTDPSYRRQIMIFTAPHIGNVGITSEDNESEGVQVPAVVVRRLPVAPSNWRSQNDLTAWLREAGTPLLIGADTRAATLHLRDAGAKRAGVFPSTIPEEQALEQVQASPSMNGADLASEVTCETPYLFSNTDLNPRWHTGTQAGRGLNVAVIDFGVKRNILQELACRGCAVTVLPASVSADMILAGPSQSEKYHGVLLSNGPGDPEAVAYGVATVKRLIGRIPLFGICLGHQLLSLAAGFKTFKLKFGHRGANHPVRRQADGVVEITSQNHGFAVTPDNAPEGWQITHINLNDHTVEGLAHLEYPIFSIQYHPEASPGPHDGIGYFDLFIKEMIRYAQA
ncbi:glutamine-hydrolyzing carbamoyl-phosphate synthase small subunit [Desulfococcaceae bacterium HSG7]|nr:glutamine-hydrolyzing carbamoyl-phosphate synthase small subunit [Desulfococcaceae bacterium HSG7]